MKHKSFIAALIAFLLILCLGAGIALAVTNITRNVNITIANSMTVTPSPDQGLTIYKNTSGDITYTVTNTSDSPYNVTVTHGTLPAGITVSIVPDAFSLVSGGNRQVVVAFTADSTAVDGTVSLIFTNDLS